ncbi:hypothetical protein Q3A66_14350 [Hymenobacter sp. BT770]|uniref:hypothetical protein n=1 Tax=Hymenobacter sp. BT770 TaxID=2886942 RepID=UPI001D1156A3|nr:hypothetical protein [Hymenobacter sp. BT770]MCC3154104.1 hypothetical protein [Hymenobacter sp. BT770]MDO3416248.1 hypothetical protein [Hymenobacter sp. BT770]
MKTFSFYSLLVAPLLILALLSKLGLIDATVFTVLLMLYVFVYHPTIVGKRLLAKYVIGKSEFAKTYIPLWNMQYYSEAFS